jgi:GDP-4-dehydro-6-deoxy-D-mannose reductase
LEAVNVLVTGATGFVGKHLVPKLRALQHTVVEVGRSAGDVADRDTWARFPRSDVTIHLAGRTFLPASWEDPAGFVLSNLAGATQALEYCREHQSRLIFLSAYLYGTPGVLPTPETTPIRYSNPYALSKQLAEQTCTFYAEAFGVTATVLRPFNAYGPGQAGHFLIPSIISQVATGEAIRVQDLSPKRDYVHIADVVDIIVRSMKIEQGYDVFNVGTGISYSVGEVIDLIQGICGTALEVISSEARRPFEIMDTRADITRAADVLGWEPQMSLPEGLRLLLGS